MAFISCKRFFLVTIICSAHASSQDLLEIFLKGNEHFRMVGGNVFSMDREVYDGRSTEKQSPIVLYDYRFDDIYRETDSKGMETGIQHCVRSLRVKLPFSQNIFQPVLGFSIQSKQFTANSYRSSDDQGEFQSRYNNVNLDYSMGFGRFVRAGASIGESFDGEHSSPQYESNISFQPNDVATMTLKTETRGYWQLLNLGVTGINGVLPLEFQQREIDASLKLSFRNVTMNVSALHTLLSSISYSVRAWNTHFVPQGTSDKIVVSSIVTFGEQWKGLLSVDWIELGGSGNFLADGMSYGKFNGIRYRDRSIQVGAQYHVSKENLFLADVEWRSIDAAVEGQIASWPFVSIFESLIPQREIFRANGSLQFWKAHGGFSTDILDAVTLGCGANYVHLVPQATLVSWEPRFLVFGVKGYKERQLLIRAVDFVILSGGLDLNVGSVGLSYSISQFVPIAIYRSGELPGQTSNSDLHQDKSATSLHSSGGQFHRFSLIYQI